MGGSLESGWVRALLFGVGLLIFVGGWRSWAWLMDSDLLRRRRPWTRWNEFYGPEPRRTGFEANPNRGYAMAVGLAMMVLAAWASWGKWPF